MERIKIILGDGAEGIENEVNEFLSRDKIFFVDIKTCLHQSQMVCTIVYREENR